MSEITLTQGQQTAYEAFTDFILDKLATVFVLEGYSGTGKSTLVETLIADLPKLFRTAKLLDPENYRTPDIILTATTNKAAEAFAGITGEEVRTIHSVLGLRVHTDYKTRTTQLKVRNGADKVYDSILFVDEASYMDDTLLAYTLDRTENCKIVLIGDPAQLLTVGCHRSPVFNAGFPTAKLEEVVRQAKGNPIIDLSTAFRHTVNTGEWSQFIPDGEFIQYLDRNDFEDAIIREFTDPGWSHNRSKVLAWTNKTVIAYNHAIRNQVKGDPHFAVGDYAIVNKFIQLGQYSLKTDQLVHITHIGAEEDNNGVIGNWYTLDNHLTAFMPKSLDDKRARLKAARASDEYQLVRIIEDGWVDLRAAYACTINKAQGSTYDKVFIDLDDIKKCNSGNQIARMLYVGISRARYQVFLTGDLV